MLETLQKEAKSVPYPAGFMGNPIIKMGNLMMNMESPTMDMDNPIINMENHMMDMGNPLIYEYRKCYRILYDRYEKSYGKSYDGYIWEILYDASYGKFYGNSDRYRKFYDEYRRCYDEYG
ncbi:hypothetical protein Fmac_017073 [Flemingia macrophylla]|uniref:Uncharacterized protein n=1 Tax=Flemingia macrophylla TaxID=520843 RepID=A0ABD1M1H5_9FABA